MPRSVLKKGRKEGNGSEKGKAERNEETQYPTLLLPLYKAHPKNVYVLIRRFLRHNKRHHLIDRVASSGAAASTRGSSFSRTSSRVHNKLNKSQRLLQMQLEDSLLHGSLIHVNNPKRTNDKFNFCGNEIRTSKYTVINFLPKNLFIQFHWVAYLYFLAIAALNHLPPLAVFGRTVSLSDRNENNREALVLQSGKFQLKRWKKICVGEVVKILADETMPCDMVLLGTSDPSGIAYIQTMNLDGESNLKTRYARQETTSLVCEGETISGVIRCEQPNRNIYEFTANMELNGHRFPLSQSNIKLRGCQLKNTEWAVGVAVYAGQETKAMLNSTASPSKRSRLETYMNRETLWLSIFLFVMCLAVAIWMGLWLKRHEEQLDTLPYYRRVYFGEGINHGKQYKYYGVPMETFFSFLNQFRIWEFDSELNDHNHRIPRSSPSSETINSSKGSNDEDVTSYSIKRKDAEHIRKR
ncbi:hypothetical protein RND71_038412 [Anisodus tanguticus]|uniref:P-type ATPase N-terminal domain-containing protein n=1 Tax=Anisodus tanguticus TaxID=243964 RepID=A0AAE1UWZ4_9SOLA|nr:hypothetical protein RND71_038412 [Anisodus tanguticus]